MRAVVIEKFGEPTDVLTVCDLPAPRPAKGEVRVRMLASPINPSDLMMVRGIYGQLPKLPATPGFEGVGIVEESAGGLLGKWLIGKRVAALNRGGGNWAEQTVLPTKQCVPLPHDLPLEQAAMFFVNPVTAYVMTRKVLAVPRGEWLIQSAAGSSLGQMIIRLGRHFGFRTLNVVRRAEQIEPLRALGADATIVFDGDRDDPAEFVENARAATGGTGIQFAIDPVGGSTGGGMIRALDDNARMLVYGSLAGEEICFSPRDLLMRSIRIDGFWLARWLEAVSLPKRLSIVRRVVKLMRTGVLINDVGRSYSLEEIAEAVRDSEQRGRHGKAWLRIDGA